MKRRLLVTTAIVALIVGASGAQAADIGALGTAYNWNGWYVGLNAGGVIGNYKFDTATSPGTYLTSPADIAAVNAAGALNAKQEGFGGGLQAGYNWQAGHFVAGIEADLDYMNLRPSATSNAVRYPVGPGVFVQGSPVPGILEERLIDQFVITDYADADWVATLRPRLGWSQGNWLFYVTGGVAFTQLKEDMLYTDGVAAFALGLEQEARNNAVLKAGAAFGAGVEAGLTDRLSLKAEYLHLSFGTLGLPQTLNTIVGTPAPGRNQVFTDSASFSADIFRLGLNYRFGVADAAAADERPIIALKAPVWKAPPPVSSAWEVEAGTRLWFSNGGVGAPQPLLGLPPLPSILISRLAYDGLDALTGETFARIDHASGLFLKAYLGAGGITRGELYDEDFPAGTSTRTAYSNTLEPRAQGDIAYATVDLGYNFVTAPAAKLGAFVGYNYYTQEINTYGCQQLAGAPVCGPGDTVSPNILGISEADHFNSLRLGLAAQFMLADRLKFTADAAYLPLINFDGLNHHNARELLLAEGAGSGDGVMLEATLGYQITDAWNIGAGARYWAWNTNTGTEAFEFLGSGGTGPVQLGRYTTERYGAFLQASYKWGNTTPQPAATIAALPTKAPPPLLVAAAPMNWTGVYVGGHLGGGWADHVWSDPFGPTPGTGGAVNVPGFGDTVHATGPLGGGQIGADWQAGPVVLGVEASASGANLFGENTCFSGLGGVDCQNRITSVATATGRLGFAWDRSLAYVKGGGAWAKDTYNLDGNTNGALALGTGSTALDVRGWTVGGGIEYALTNHWSALAEYDRIALPTIIVPFPTVAMVNTQTISVKQTVDVWKLGVNYKFNFADLARAN